MGGCYVIAKLFEVLWCIVMRLLGYLLCYFFLVSRVLSAVAKCKVKRVNP